MVVGITGTNGGGKGAVVDYLVRKGFAHYSVRDFLVSELQRRNLPVNRTTMGGIATELRHTESPTYFTERFLAQARERGQDNVLIESIRTIAEAKSVQEHGGIVLAVDAPLEVRYRRIVGRGTHTDKVTLEEFRAQEDAEYRSEDPNDPALMNVLGVMEIADVVITNNGALANLHKKIDEALQR